MAVLQFVAQNHEVLWFFCGLIVLTAVVAGIRYRAASGALRQNIRGLTQVIISAPDEASRSDLARLIDESPVGGSYLADRFKAWTITLIKGGEGSGPRYFSTIAPASALNVDAVAAHAINFRLVQAIPNILIGMGLFFTFLGLTAALMFAAQGATSPDVSTAQQSLRGLLDAATFKFTTSLFGLACSIAFGYFEKAQYKKLQEATGNLLSLLTERFPFISPQQLLEQQSRAGAIRRAARLSMIESLEVLNSSLESPVGLALVRQDVTRMREEAEEQTAILKTFSTDLAASIAKAINESLTPQLTSTFEQLQDRIDHIGQQLNSTNADALRSIVTDFRDQFQAQAQQSFHQMMSAVDVLTDNIGKHSERFEHSFERVQEVVVALRDDGGRMLEGIRSTVDSLTTSVTRLEGLAELLQQAAEPLSRASESASTVMEKVYDTQMAATEMVKRLENVSEGFRGIDGDLTVAFTAMHSGFERLAEDLRTFVIELDGSFSRALSGVRDVTDSLGSGVEGLSEGLDGFATNVQSLQSTVDKMEAALRLPSADADISLNGSDSTPFVPN